MYTKTLQDCYNICYWIIAQPQDSTAYPTELMKSFINKAQNDIMNWWAYNMSTWERIEKQAVSIWDSTQFYSSKSSSTIWITTSIGATSINTKNTLTNSWLLWIQGAIISYTSNNGSVISGIPTTGSGSIPFPFTAWTKIFQLDTLPTDCGSISKIYYTQPNTNQRIALIPIDTRDLSNTSQNSMLYPYLFNNSYSINSEWYYTVIQNIYILYIVPQLQWQAISMEYQKKPTNLSSTTDLLSIPDEYSLNTIPYMAISEMMANRWEMEEAIKLNAYWFNNIKTMLQYYWTTRWELQYNMRVRTWSDSLFNF